MTPYSDRFEPNQYDDDETVAVAYCKPNDSIEWWKGNEADIAWVPERIFTRAQAIAAAYELHLLPVINIYEKTELNSKQAQALDEELTFIHYIVNDALLGHWISAMRKSVQKVLQSPREMVIITEGS
jgi:hypothetical protein